MPRCKKVHKLWWETKLTTCCDCTAGKIRFRKIWISIIMYESGRNSGLSRQPGCLTDSSRMAPAVPPMVTFSPSLLDLHTSMAYFPYHTSDNRFLYLLYKTEAFVSSSDEISEDFRQSKLSVHACVLLLQCVCVCEYAYLYLLLALLLLLTKAKGWDRTTERNLSLCSECRDLGQNEPVNEPQDEK